MGERIDKTQLVSRIAKRLSKTPAEIEPVADAVLEEIYEALKREESVTLRNFGTFYIDLRRSVLVQYSSSTHLSVSGRCLAGRLRIKASCEVHPMRD